MIAELALGVWLTTQPVLPRSAFPMESQEPVESARLVDGRLIEAPRPVKHALPKYPGNALRAGLRGRVVIECEVDLAGKVTSVKPLQGPRSLVAAAIDAVRKWSYTPAIADGKAVPAIITVTVNFVLQKVPRQSDLLKVVKDRDPEIRAAAIAWLGKSRPVNQKQREAIETAIRDPSPIVQDQARLALKSLE